MTESEGVSRWAIPKTWSWVSIGDICEVVGGGTPSTAEAKNFDGGDIPWITPADLSGYTGKFIEAGARSITRSGLEGSGARLMPAGTVLFSSRAPIGYVAIAKGPVATNQGFKSFIPPTGLNSDYLYYYLKHAKGLAVELSSGTTFQEISGKKAARIPLVVAPEPEQERIVEKLEEFLSDLDAGVSALDRARANLKRYRAAVLKAAVEGRLTEKWRAAHPDVEPAEKLLARILAERRRKWEEAQLRKFAEKKQVPPKGWKEKYSEPVKPDVSALPVLPTGWCWANLDQLKKWAIYGPRFSSSAYVESGCLVLRTTDFSDDGAIDLQSPPQINLTDEEYSKYKVEPGDLLITRTGSLGTLAVFQGGAKAIAGAFLLHYRLLVERATVQYINYFFRSPGGNRALLNSGRGVGRPNLNMPSLENIPVPFPPLMEQEQINAAVDLLFSSLSWTEGESYRSIQRGHSLQQAILKRAFEGKLVPQDPKDEPASELLARIRAERLKEKGQVGGVEGAKPRGARRGAGKAV